MPHPEFRRCEASATVYWESTPEGYKVSRLVVDCPLPLLEAPRPLEHDLRELREKARSLADVVRQFLLYPADADRVVSALAAVEALTMEVAE